MNSFSYLSRKASGYSQLTRMAAIQAAAIVIAAITASLIAPYPPEQTFFDGLTIEGAPLPPSLKYWFGTDLLGRDLFSLVLYGAQTSLVIGLLANGISLAVGTLVGVLAGFLRGWVGAALMRFTDLMMCFPALLMAIVLSAIFTPSLWIVAMVIAMVNWVQIARVVYTQTLSLAERGFVEAARSLGVGDADPLLRDTQAMAQRLVAESVPHVVKVYAGMPHGFLSMSRLLTIANDAIIDAAQAARRLATGSGQGVGSMEQL
jgi:ABC-type dipeptide/oligopeptide/nickel transport system permease subunit